MDAIGWIVIAVIAIVAVLFANRRKRNEGSSGGDYG
jgi:hypothetical protein